MHPLFDINVMAHWASWRLSSGNQLVGRLIVDADSRAIVWMTAWRLADVVGSAAATITMGAAAGLTLRRSRLNRCRAKPPPSNSDLRPPTSRHRKEPHQ